MAPLLGDWTGSNSGPDSGVDQKSILYVDAYDSFSYNVVAMLEEVLGVRVTVMMIDAEWPDGNMVEFLQHYDAVVLGPGPGDPNIPKDVGVMADVWNLSRSDMLPVLGICLGFQSLCLHHGIPIDRLPEPLHGQVHRITTAQRDMFENVQDLEVTLYHSLYARFDDHTKSTPRSGAASSKPALDLLAWLTIQPDSGPSRATRIPMAGRHREKPFWGVQFHPESCKSDREACNELLRKWWEMSVFYNKRHERGGYGSLPTDIIRPVRGATSLPDAAFMMVNWSASSSKRSASRSLLTRQLDAEAICESLNAPGSPTVLFRSNGRHSILSIPSPGSWRLEYYVQKQSLLLEKLPVSSSLRNASGAANTKVEAPMSVSQLWDVLRYLMNLKKVELGDSEVPFWAGFLGYFSYELGLACLAHPQYENGSVQDDWSKSPADVSLLWTDRSIVVDNETGRITLQSTREEDDLPAGWLNRTIEVLQSFPCADVHSAAESFMADEKFLDSVLRQGVVRFPDQDTYLSQVEACKVELRAGESYELCLTCETSITVPSPGTTIERVEFPWKLYKRLWKYNPATFSAYARLGNVKIVSSSPECFLTWDRHSTLEMKPMKGTVKKSDTMTMEKAREILGSTKEMAENLMIADLIRHDLYGICGVGGVHVEKLLEVEDHGRVYQMITHIKGHVDPCRPGYAAKSLPRLESPNMSIYGLTALQRCLPAGSMTGAPKERSCMHLSSIEGRKRGVYSGVMGFLDLGGGGSFSVMIRTAFTSSDDGDDVQKWRIGAGGAVTMLSSAEGEWDEMLTKLRTVCGIFMSSHRD
ncbi:ADC synthase [Aspergillus cavernicola]|uniref:aminodeoxychorismate synthase n=1 Tax=Aspergillus cavernicola TaxID=176166 RepID=A0ABR4IKN4_9EURO